MRRSARSPFVAAAWVVTMGARPLSAQPTPEDRAVAETLFQQARSLMEEKRYGEACPKLEESQRVAPAGGTLLNLAACHEAQGRIAAAWAEYRDAEVQAAKAGRADRQKIARERIDALAPQVPKLVVVVSPEIAALAPRLTRDGTEMGAAAWGVEIPLDPGIHVVRVVAAGRVPWEARVDLLPSRVERVVVPPLEPLVSAVPAPVGPVASADGPPLPPPLPPPSVPSTQRIVGWSLLAGGAVSLGIGAYFGLRALSKHGDSDGQCNGRLCTPEGFVLNEDARSAARTSNAFLAIGLVLAGGGIAVALTAPSQKTEVSLGLTGTLGNMRVRW